MIITFMLVILTSHLTNGYRNSYDFIVVGSGAGGSTVAGRLAENNFSVLLLEMGGYPREGYDVPAFAPRFFSDSQVTFHYASVPQRHAALQQNGVIGIFTGKMLGGTTSLNYMWWNRGHPRCWNQWADVTGVPSWSYSNMLKYMKKSEDYHGDFPSDQHGHGGPITVSRPKYAPGLEKHWLEAGRELGYPIGDPNGPQKQGFSAIEFSKKRGRRVSSFVGYVQPLLNKSNLDVLINATARNIVFSAGRAVAIRVHTQSPGLPSEMIFLAEKEIIISAGTYNSPLLLQRSGVGPKDLLRAANIPIVKELPVGNNFQDHPFIILNFAINDSSTVMEESRDLTPENWQYYLETGDGPFSQSRGVTGQAFLASSIAVSEGNSEWPDHQIWSPAWIQSSSNLNLLPGEVPISTYLFLGRGKSRGSVKINPKNIFGNPLIDPGYLTDARDVQIVLDGIRNVFRINEGTEAYKKLGTRFLPPNLPACANFPMRSDPYWKCVMTQTMQGGCHGSGTNKMGSRDDPSAVVDPELRVIGLDGLRVVDGSIMPFISNSNPQSVIYSVAEFASDMIMKTWTNSRFVPSKNNVIY